MNDDRGRFVGLDATGGEPRPDYAVRYLKAMLRRVLLMCHCAFRRPDEWNETDDAVADAVTAWFLSKVPADAVPPSSRLVVDQAAEVP